MHGSLLEKLYMQICDLYDSLKSRDDKRYMYIPVKVK